MRRTRRQVERHHLERRAGDGVGLALEPAHVSQLLIGAGLGHDRIPHEMRARDDYPYHEKGCDCNVGEFETATLLPES